MSNVYFSEVAEWYLAEASIMYGKPKSENAHRRVGEMVDFWGRRLITQIDDKAVERFFNHIKSLDRSPATINTSITYYRAVMNYARDKKRLIQYVPAVSRLPERQLATFLEPRQLNDLMASLDPLRRNMVQFAVWTGLRKSNVADLRIDWISQCGNYITFPSTEMKNGTTHEVPLAGAAKEVVDRRLEMVRELQDRYHWLDPIQHVFVQSGPRKELIGKPLTQVTNRAWRTAVKKAGLPKGTRFHDLRHTFASMHKRAGTDALDIQRLGGWQSSKSMERYAHVSGPDLRRAAHNLGSVMQG